MIGANLGLPPLKSAKGELGNGGRCFSPQGKTNGWLSRLLILIVGGMLLRISLPTARANELSSAQTQYHVEGSLAYFVEGNPIPKFTREFQLTVSNSDWDIRVEPDTNSPDEGKLTDYFDVVHLGDTIYYYTSMGNIPPSAGVANNGTAVVNNGDVPLEKGSFSSFIWLGLASSYYFQGSTNREIQPIWSGRDIMNTRVKAHWELFDTLPFLPKQVTYYRNGNGLPPAFKGGWKAAELRVLSETNIGNLEIPVEYTYEQFRPKTDATGVDDLETNLVVRVVAQSVRLLSAGVMSPLTHGRTLIEEERFSKAPELSVEYTSTNNRLPDAPLKSVVEQHEKLVAISEITHPESPTNNWKAKTIVILFFILSAVVFVMLVQKNKQNK